jgi:hypothetical protein
MAYSEEGPTETRRNETEARLSHWECVVIKCFAILFLILFLSEKAVKEAGSIRKTWDREITAPLPDSDQGAPGQGFSDSAMNCPYCHRVSNNVNAPTPPTPKSRAPLTGTTTGCTTDRGHPNDSRDIPPADR